MDKSIYIPASEAAECLGISIAALHKNRLAGKYLFSGDESGYMIELRSLSMAAQSKYWAKHNASTADHQSAVDESAIYMSAPEHARRKADKYLALIKQVEGLSGDALRNAIGLWNAKNPDQRTSYPRLLDARKRYMAHGISALLGQHGKRAGESNVPDELFAFYKSLYLKEGRPSAVSCWKITLGKAAELGYDTTNFPSHMAFDRRVKKEVPETAICNARDGAGAANRKYGFYIRRDMSDVLAGECWISDHAQLDMACTYVDKQGRTKVCFPWITAWRDFKSGFWTGYDIHTESPNSDHIFLAAHRGIIKHGRPAFFYLDNGKDYRSKDFAGGRKKFKLVIDENKTTSLTAALGITSIFAWPYNAQSKSIERDFLRNKEWFSKHSLGYRGGNHVERPESLNANIAAHKIMSFEELQKVLDVFINEVVMETAITSGPRAGMRPREIWANEYPLAIEKGLVKFYSKQALMLFCTRTSSVHTIGKRGFRDSELGVDYYGSWMEGQKGRKVYLRRDPKAMEEAWVFDAKSHAYLDNAYLLNSVAAIARTDVQREDLKASIAIKRTAIKLMRDLGKPESEIPFADKISLMAKATKIINEQEGYTPQSTMPFVPEIQASNMDFVAAQRNRNKKDGTQDISVLANRIEIDQQKTRKLYAWDSDRDEAIAAAN